MDSFHKKTITHVVAVQLNVTNINKSVEFYKEIIGLQVLAESDRKVVLTADGETALITLVEPENVEPKSPRTAGLYHVAFLLPTRADLAQFLKHLLRNGVRFGAADHLVSEAIYLDDPDGNGIEVYRDRPASEWTWREGEVAMATDPLLAEELMAETDALWKGMPAKAKLGHLHLHVADLTANQTFYEALGFSVVSHYPGAVFMSTGNYHHHVALNTWNGVGVPAAKQNSVGLDFFDVQYADEAEREKVINQLTKRDFAVQKIQENYFTADLSGNKARLIIS